MAAAKEVEAPPSISIQNLTYTFPDGTLGLQNINLSLPPRSRTLLIGANGAGKTTLLRLLSGRRMSPPHTISICALDPFSSTPVGLTYLGLEWVLNGSTRGDMPISTLLHSIDPCALYPSRLETLLQILDIDTTWHMHRISDGERRRVQLCMGLLLPWRVLLLDEITVDLDLLSRSRFLEWLGRETRERECTVVYATHVLDGLAGWATHLVHMSFGRVKKWGRMEEFVAGEEEDGEGKEVMVMKGSKTGMSMLGELVLRWLGEDLAERGPRGGSGRGGEGKTYESFEGMGGYGLEEKRSGEDV